MDILFGQHSPNFSVGEHEMLKTINWHCGTRLQDIFDLETLSWEDIFDFSDICLAKILD
jgi:hypothetical protein